MCRVLIVVVLCVVVPGYCVTPGQHEWNPDKWLEKDENAANDEPGCTDLELGLDVSKSEVLELRNKIVELEARLADSTQHMINNAKNVVEMFRSSEKLRKNNTRIMKSACDDGNVAVVSALFDLGLSCETRLNLGDFNCMHMAAGYGQHNLVNALITRGCDVNAVNYEGITPLMVAANLGKLRVVKDLVNSGADITLRVVNGNMNVTALDGAINGQNADVVQYLKSINAPE